jgi:hypothetical protein
VVVVTGWWLVTVLQLGVGLWARDAGFDVTQLPPAEFDVHFSWDAQVLSVRAVCRSVGWGPF